MLIAVGGRGEDLLRATELNASARSCLKRSSGLR